MEEVLTAALFSAEGQKDVFKRLNHHR